MACRQRYGNCGRGVWGAAEISLRVTVTLGAMLMAACAVSPPPPASVDAAAPARFHAPVPADLLAASPAGQLPHGGSIAALTDWWAGQGDPLLVELVAAAQAASPTLSAALSAIGQARLGSVSAGAALLPRLDASAGLARSRASADAGASPPPANSAQLGLQTSWEIDLAGRLGALRDAAGERLRGAEALWHDARVSVAAELANQYYALRACHALLEVSRADTLSRSESSRLTGLASQAGFEAPATAMLAQASAADSRSRTARQAAQCELETKVLVALTAMPEPLLREKLAQAPASPQAQAMMVVPALPAAVLAQRPDVFNAAREVAAASFDVGSAQGEHYPRLTLNGSVTSGRSRQGASSMNFNTWSIGPLSLTLPLFDGGAASANTAAAIARYDKAASHYRATARQAVREVEEALVRLQATAERSGDAALAADSYQASFTATQARHRAGLASLVELEDARRTWLAAQGELVSLERERRSAWVALYRALGGGWTPQADLPATANAAVHSSLR